MSSSAMSIMRWLYMGMGMEYIVGPFDLADGCKIPTQTPEGRQHTAALCVHY
jgi:hypothetical protein